ncbi:MAG: DUF3313 family protein [Verrucomicrobiaceae bacterium]|nr:DUF3313 family protein [Verrucomicrobiaceae bacterium]
MHRLSLLLLALAASLLCSCKTAKSVVASVSVKPSAFLTHGNELKEDRSKSPFLGNWWTNDKKLQAAADEKTQIYIAPVSIDAVRPMQNYLAKVEFSDKRRQKKLEELAKYAHKKFVSAFKGAKHPRYTVVDAPSKDAMTLDLHLLEWEPNALSGFIARETIDLLTFPAVGDLIWKPVRASTTIEGRLIEPKSKKPVYEFADKEEAKTIIVIPVQEAYPTGQARFAIREWAKQLQLVLHKEPHKKPVDSSPIQLWGF